MYRAQVKIIALSFVVIGPLVAVLQIQFGERAGLGAAAERQLNEVNWQISQAKSVQQVAEQHNADLLLLDSAVPVGTSHDSLITTLNTVASKHNARLKNFTLQPDEQPVGELQLARYRANIDNFEAEFSGVNYERVKALLDSLKNSRRPIEVKSWVFNSQESILEINGRVMYIEDYVAY